MGSTLYLSPFYYWAIVWNKLLDRLKIIRLIMDANLNIFIAEVLLPVQQNCPSQKDNWDNCCLNRPTQDLFFGRRLILVSFRPYMHATFKMHHATNFFKCTLFPTVGSVSLSYYEKYNNNITRYATVARSSIGGLRQYGHKNPGKMKLYGFLFSFTRVFLGFQDQIIFGESKQIRGFFSYISGNF